MTRVRVTMPARGVTPDTIVTTGNGSVFVGSKAVGTIVGVVEVRHDEVVVELDVQPEHVDDVKDNWDQQFRGYTQDEDVDDKVTAVFHKGQRYDTLEEALNDNG